MDIKTMVELRAGRVQITEDPETGAATVTLEVDAHDQNMRSWAETVQKKAADLEQKVADLRKKGEADLRMIQALTASRDEYDRDRKAEQARGDALKAELDRISEGHEPEGSGLVHLRDRVAQLQQDLDRANAKVEHLEHERTKERDRADASRGWAEWAEARIENLEEAEKRSADNANTRQTLLDDALWRLGEITKVVQDVGRSRHPARALKLLEDLDAALTAERPE